MKILVSIASYGRNNDAYLHRLIAEYSSMPWQVDIIVLSNINKPVPENTTLVVCQPGRNPWSLPFSHKNIFADRLDDYELFIYSEDDTLITENNIRAFLEVQTSLPPGDIAGFMRSETGEDNTVYYSTVHKEYHWDSASACRHGGETFAFFSNEHGACYILTKEHLRTAINSGGYLVEPHETKYDMLVSAATDPYTQCGFRKLICISRLDDFTCKHLSNKYVNRIGLKKSDVEIQIQALMGIATSGEVVHKPLCREPKLPRSRWAKSYYEPCRDDMLSLIPEHATRVLSIGCGSGNSEKSMMQNGLDVSAIPLDVVIGKLAEENGIEIASQTLEADSLKNQNYDVVFVSALLHLVDDPAGLLQECRKLLATDGVLILSCPNFRHISVMIQRLMRRPNFQRLGDFQHSGVHPTYPKKIRQWFRQVGLSEEYSIELAHGRWKAYDKLSLGLFRHLLMNEFLVVARPSALH